MQCVSVPLTFDKSHFDESSIIVPCEPRVEIKDNAVRLTFSDSDEVTTLRGLSLSAAIRSQSWYEYPLSDINKIPHDMVHSTLSPVPEGTVVMGQTPDIVWYDHEGKCNVIEIATRNVYTFEDARGAIDEKMATYGWQIRKESIDRFNILVVYHTGIITLGGVLSRTSIERLISAYNIGFKILDKIYDATGVKFDPYMDDASKFRAMINTLQIHEVPCDNRESQCIITPEDSVVYLNSDHNHKLAYQKEDFMPDRVKTLRAWLIDLPGRKDQEDVVVHLPLVEFQKEQLYYPSLPEYRNLVELVMLNDSKPRDLKLWREYDLSERKKIKKIDGSTQSELVHIPIQDKICLARRGLFKKSLMHLEVVQEYDRQQSETYSPYCSVSDIDHFLSSPLVIQQNPYMDITCLEEFHIPDNTGFDPHFVVKELLNTDLFSSLCLLDRIVREVIINMKNNPKDRRNKDLYEFHYKQISDTVNIIFRTTKFAEDSPIFFMIVSIHPMKPIHGIFEQVYMTGNYYHTKFTSLSSRRAEHLCNLVPQCINLASMIFDEMGPGLSDFTIDRFNSVIKPFKTLLLILLEDKEFTSRNLQQMRYYYMEALSNGFQYAGKISSKLDHVCRSRLFLYIVKQTIDLEADNIERMQKFKTTIIKDESDEISDVNNEEADDYEADDPVMEEKFFKRLEARQDKIDIMCFLGFRHKTLQTLLTPMYSSVLHNKNEMERMVSAKKLTNKIIKEELKLPASLYAKGDFDEIVQTRKYKSHDWSYRVVKKASLLLKAELEGMCAESLSMHAIKEVMKTNLDDLATTKSSHSGICQTPINNDDDLVKIGKRDKCLIEVLERDWVSPRLISNVGLLINHMRILNNDRVNVQLFRKNQIGGVREIYILDFISRCLIRVLEDFSRSLCKIHPYEMLTKPENKHTIIGNHFFEVRKKKGFVATMRMSLDKTTWAQQFVNPLFFTMLQTLLPEYSELIRYILNCHTRKILELPKDLIKSFIHAEHPHLNEYEVNNLREEFLGFKEPYLLEQARKPFMRNISNMMQGILHYTSSLLHTAMLVYIKAHIQLIEKAFNERNPDNCVQIVYTPQTSSDDSGILISFVLEKDENSDKIVTKLIRIIQRMMKTVDEAFCVRTSIEKSSITLNSKYEFNSMFFSENNVAVPLIKFVARVSDDNPAESLRSRISNLYSSLREVRANSGSGALCSVCSVSQKISMFQNLGFGSMNFFPEYLELLRMYKISHVGVYISHPPLVAGLYGCDLSDYYQCRNDPFALSLLSIMHKNPTIGGHLLSEFSTTYRAWPIRKYSQLLDQLGIDPAEKHEMSFADLEFLFRPSISVEDTKKKIRMTLSNTSMARSFAFLTRCQSIMASTYLLWDKIFSIDGTKRYALDELVHEAMSHEVEPLDLNVLFQNHADLSLVVLTCQSDVITMSVKTKFIFRNHTYNPLFSGLNNMKQIKDTLSTKWYGMKTSLSKTASDRTFSSMQSVLPWLSSDPNETLLCSGLDSPISLINYLLLLSEKVKPITIISMGGTRRNKGMIENIALMNCFRNKITKLHNDPELAIQEEFLTGINNLPILQIQNRLADWHSLAMFFHKNEDYQEELSTIMSDDILHIIENNFQQLQSSMMMGSSSMSAAQLCSLIDPNSFSRMRSDPDITFLSWIKIQRKVKGKYVGKGLLYRKYDSHFEVLVTVNGEVVTEVRYKGEVLNKNRVMKEFNYLDFKTSIWINEQDIIIPVPNAIRYWNGKLWAISSLSNNRSINTVSFLYPLKIRSTFSNITLPTNHWKTKSPIERLWISRNTNQALIMEMCNRYPDMIPKMIALSIGAYRNASNSLVRANFIRSENRVETKASEEADVMDTFMGGDDWDMDMLMDNVTSEMFDLSKDITPEEMYVGVIENTDLDIMAFEYRSEADVSIFTEHPLLPILIRNIETRSFSANGMGLVALDASLELGLITEEQKEQILLSQHDLLSLL